MGFFLLSTARGTAQGGVWAQEEEGDGGCKINHAEIKLHQKAVQPILDFETSEKIMWQSHVALQLISYRQRRTIRADLRSSLRLQHNQFSPEVSTMAEDWF